MVRIRLRAMIVGCGNCIANIQIVLGYAVVGWMWGFDKKILIRCGIYVQAASDGVADLRRC